MGQDGWLGVGWPKEWGGRGFSAVEQFIWFDEAMRLGRPGADARRSTPSGPTIMRFGTDEQKRVLPPQDPQGRGPLLHRLLRARRGHRPRRATTKAERDGDEYVINGPKVLTSLASGADSSGSPAHQPEGQEAPGDLALRHPDVDAGFTVRPIHVIGEPTSTRSSTRTSGSPPTSRVGERERRLEAHHEPAEPRARHPVLVGHGRGALRPGPQVGRRRPGGRAASGRRRAVGATGPRRG